MDDSDIVNFMGYQWLRIEDGVVTVGISDEGAADLTDDITLHLPEEDDSVSPGKICGEIETDGGNLNLYSPVAGTIIEINEAILENPELILDDPMDEGWLFKVEADNPEKINLASIRGQAAAHSTDDDDGDDDEDEDDDFDDEDEHEGEDSGPERDRD
jgi:glycine cleavage system H protein